MMPGIRILAVFVSFASLPALAEDGRFSGVQKLAERMLKRTQDNQDSAYCERISTVAKGGCIGPGRMTQRIRIGRDGLVEIWVHQPSPGSGGPVGYSRGRMDVAQWNGLLRKLAVMRPEPLPPGMPMPLPPEPDIPVPVLTLSDGMNKAEFGNAGPSPGSIGDAFAQIDILARNATDTIWTLALVRPKAEIRKDSIHVTAEWSWRGPAGTRNLFSRQAGGEGCGKAAFKWYLDTSEATVEWRTATATPGKGRGMSWELPISKAAPLRLAFPHQGQKGKAKRVGLLDGIGIRLIPAGSKDTVSATLSTDRFAF